MQEFKLFPASGKVIVAVSTGLDSMALLHFFLECKKQKLIRELEVVHIHHGLRKASDKEANFLINFCQEKNIIINYMRLGKPGKQSNLEAWGRSERYKFFDQVCGANDFLATAHHLDDSFEWWLMNRLKSSSKPILGIPVRNKKIIRPFLCVSRKQIKRYCEIEKLAFFEDETNSKTRFERNYLRNAVMPLLIQRYPKLLKHYALRSLREINHSKAHNYKEYSYSWGSHYLFPVNQVPDTQILLRSFQKISTIKRGTLSKELSKLTVAISNGKKGPMSFSGGVKIFFNRNELLMINQKGFEVFQKIDQQLLGKLKKSNETETYSVENFLKLRESGALPFSTFVLTQDEKLQHAVPSIRKASTLFPQLTRFLIKNNVWFCSGNHLELQVSKNPSLLKRKLLIIKL